MTAAETRKYEMLVRVRELGDSRADLFPTSPPARKAFADVEAAIGDARQLAVSKMSAGRDGARTRAAARAALSGRLVAMSHTARVIEHDTAGIEGKFQLPDTKGDQALTTAGRLFAHDATAFAAQFIARAMPKTFIKDLLGLVDTLEAAITAAEAERGARTAARANITAALAKGTTAVQALEAMVANHLHGNAAELAVWEVARRIDHRRLGRPRGARAKDDTPAPAAPPAPAPPVTPGSSPAVAVSTADHNVA